jgi:hypothetical protein
MDKVRKPNISVSFFRVSPTVNFQQEIYNSVLIICMSTPGRFFVREYKGLKFNLV